MSSIDKLNPKLNWLLNEDIRPYILARDNCRVKNPGQYFPLDFFPQKPIFMNPLKMKDIGFSDSLLDMETKAFALSGMSMPRWVYFDCAVMPGFIAGFAHKSSTLPQGIIDLTGAENKNGEWTPISIFIVIPTMVKGEWVAHNLSSVNSLIPREKQYYGLGFLSKAFGLAYGNIEVCCGMTQWGSPALRLHSHYGVIELLTAFTPAHTYESTVTYRLNVDPSEWVRFFTKEESEDFNKNFVKTGFIIDPRSKESQIELQRRIEAKEGPFFLNATQIRKQKLDQALEVYQLNQEGNL